MFYKRPITPDIIDEEDRIGDIPDGEDCVEDIDDQFIDPMLDEDLQNHVGPYTNMDYIQTLLMIQLVREMKQANLQLADLNTHFYGTHRH